jgi:hypothetical protein
MYHRAVMRLAVFASIAFVLSGTAFAAGRHRLDPEPFAQLTRPLRGGARVQVKNVPLVDGKLETLELEEFNVLAPGAVIEFIDGDKKERIKPAPMRQFRGGVAGVPESLAYVSVGSEISGLVIVRERKFMLRTTKSRGGTRQRDSAFNDDVTIEEIADIDDFASNTGFTCGTSGEVVLGKRGDVPQSLARGVAPNAAPTGTQTTMLNLAVQTDSAMYANFGSNATSVETFTRNLVGTASVIYKRDLSTELRITYLSVAGAADPWSINPHAPGQSTTAALLQYGDYWHNTPPSPNAKSAAVLLSGHYAGTPQSWSAGGIAWSTGGAGSLLCSGEFFLDPQYYPPSYANHWAGPYAFCGGLGISTADRTAPNPDANPNYAAPSDGYWALLQFSHELGHIAQSPHTHCIQMTPSDQATYGRTYVDNCFNADTAGGCFTGTQSLPADGAGGKGTIMSYCHLTFGGANSRFTFGQPGEASHRIRDDMRAAIANITPNGLSSITAPASLATGATGNASVTNTAGLTYDWTITNGTFTGGSATATGNSVSFSGTVSPVTLRVTATNASGCSISDVASVTLTQQASITPPTNVIATATSATSVSVTWSAVVGATSYQIFRRSAGGTFGQIGTSPTNNYADNSAVANTAYLYMVRAFNGTASTDSNADLATTVVFTDASLASVAVKATHMLDATTAVNAVRTLAGLGAVTLVPAPSLGTAVRNTHVDTLRTGLAAARAALSLSAVTFTDPTITPGSTRIKAVHVTDLRSAVQ